MFSFGPFRLDERQRTLFRGEQPVKLPLRSIELLTWFVKHPNVIIDKETLMREIWAGSFVEESNISVHISNLRKALDLKNGNSNGISIETFPKVGYRFNAEVYVAEEAMTQSGNAESVTAPPVVVVPAEPNGLTPLLRSRAVLIGAAAIVLLASGYSISRWFRGAPPRTPTMTAIPGIENSSSIALSPNGQYVASSLRKDGQYQLVLADVGSGSRLELIPPQDRGYLGLTFSPDNSFLYYVKAGDDRKPLYKIPILGGTPLKILDNVDNHISFSPKGERFCFVRRTAPDETSIMIANTDGTGERTLATKRSPEYFSTYEISWSPDGKLIANAVGNWNGRKLMSLVGVEVETGKEKLLADATWAGIDGIAWMPDGSGIVGGFFPTGNSPTEVAIIPYPSGQIKRLTNDTLNYGSIHVSSDGKTVLAGQFKDHWEIWLSSYDGSQAARPLATERRHSFRWIRWTADERIVFGSDVNGTRDVWIMNGDGSNAKQLTVNTGSNVMPVMSTDGRLIVFASNRAAENKYDIWKAEPSGDNPAQLTFGQGGNQPSITPDGRWVFYTSGGIDSPKPERRVWKVSIDGGEPIPFISEPSYGPAVSPDGKQVAVWLKQSDDSPWKIAIYRIEGGSPVATFDALDGPPVVWTPDGKAVSYLKTEKGISNIWNQPIDGTPAASATHFTSNRISHFHWSKTGKLAVTRTFRTGDMVLIRDFD